MKTEKEIIQHNNLVNVDISELDAQIAKLKTQRAQLKAKLIPPCKHCPPGVLYRCEACEEFNWEGFKNKDFLSY